MALLNECLFSDGYFWLSLSKLESFSSSSSFIMCIVIGLSIFIPYPPTLFFLLNSSIIFVCVFILSSAFSSIPNNCSTVYSLLILGEFLTALALCPNLREVMVSASLKDEGEILTINEVKEFPPRLSCSNLVSFESL